MLETEKLSSIFGVRVVGLDLTKPIAAATADALQALLKRHRLLLFRQGPIDEAAHMRLMEALGRVIVEAPGGNPVSYVSTNKNDYVGTAGRLLWHADGQFSRTGAMQAISLYAMEMERREPTKYADMVRAASTLTPLLRARVKGLEIVQCLDLSSSGHELERCRLSNKAPDTPDSQWPRAVHSLLGAHPFTGEQMLNVSQYFTSHVVGLTDAQSDALFAELEPIQYAPENVYEHDWQIHDLVIWDNVALQHSRDVLGESHGRKLRRITINPLDNSEMLQGITPDPSLSIGAGGW